MRRLSGRGSAYSPTPHANLGVVVANDEVVMDAPIWHCQANVQRMLRHGSIHKGASWLVLHRYYAALQDGRVA